MQQEDEGDNPALDEDSAADTPYPGDETIYQAGDAKILPGGGTSDKPARRKSVGFNPDNPVHAEMLEKVMGQKEPNLLVLPPRQNAGLRIFNRSGAVMIAFSWNIALRFAMWEAIQGPTATECPEAGGDSTHMVDPSRCSPSGIANAVHVLYAVITTILIVPLGKWLNHKALNDEPRKVQWVVFLQLCIFALSLLPGWTWASVLSGLTMTLPGGWNVLGLYAFSVIVTVICTFLNFAFARVLPRRRLKYQFIRSSAEAMSISAGVCIALVWTNAIGGTITLVTRKGGGRALTYLAVALLTTIVIGVGIALFPFKRMKGSQPRRRFEHFIEELAGDVVGFSWAAMWTTVTLDILGEGNAALAWWVSLLAALTVSVLAVLWVVGFERLKKGSRISLEDEPQTKMLRFRSQFIHLSGAIAGAVVGSAWGTFSNGIFWSVYSSYSWLSFALYIVYPCLVTVIFFVLIFIITKKFFSSTLVATWRAVMTFTRKVHGIVVDHNSMAEEETDRLAELNKEERQATGGSAEKESVSLEPEGGVSAAASADAGSGDDDLYQTIGSRSASTEVRSASTDAGRGGM